MARQRGRDLDPEEEFALIPIQGCCQSTPEELEHGSRWTDTAELCEDLAAWLAERPGTASMMVTAEGTVLRIRLLDAAVFEAQVRLAKLL